MQQLLPRRPGLNGTCANTNLLPVVHRMDLASLCISVANGLFASGWSAPMAGVWSADLGILDCGDL